MDNAAALDIARAVGLARAVAALVDGGATALAQPIARELLGVLEAAQLRAMQR